MTEYCGGYRQPELVECDKEHGQCSLCFIAELEVFNEEIMNESWRLKVENAKLKEENECLRASLGA